MNKKIKEMKHPFGYFLRIIQLNAFDLARRDVKNNN